MTRPLPLPYITDHPHARTVMSAVAEGLGRDWVPACSAGWRPEPAIVYGILRGTGDVIRRCAQAGIDWWHIDLGYWGRGHYDGYYRLSRNGMQHPPQITATEARISIPVYAPWGFGTGPIVVCPPTALQAIEHPLERLDVNEWTDTILRALAKAAIDRPVIVRTKNERAEYLPRDAWCVIAHSSNILIDALTHGIPAIGLGAGIVRDLGPVFADIVDAGRLRSINRTRFFSILSNAQFTLEEFRQGVPWRLYGYA